MSRVIFMTSLLLILAVFNMRAETQVALDSTSSHPGDTVKVSLRLNNPLAISGLQFVIASSSAEHLTFLRAVAVGRAEGWTVSSNTRDGGWIFIVYSAQGENIMAGNDSILTFEFHVAEDAPLGKINLALSEMILSDIDLNPVADLQVMSGGIMVEEKIPVNKTPIAIFTYTPQSGTPPLTVNFDASASFDPDGSISSYGWNFGDGDMGEGTPISHSFEDKGTFTVLLTVTDTAGATGVFSRDVLVYESEDYERGDVNRDGKTDIFDLIELLGILAGNRPK